MSESTALEKLELSRISEKELTAKLLQSQQRCDELQESLANQRAQAETKLKYLRGTLNVRVNSDSIEFPSSLVYIIMLFCRLGSPHPIQWRGHAVAAREDVDRNGRITRCQGKTSD